MNRVLLVCFYFPPIQSSTGSLRAASLARYLPAEGWQPTVLTVSPGVYARSDTANEVLLGDQTEVVRTVAWDVSRAFSMRGRYPRLLGYPDRWQTWFFTAVTRGRRICRERRPAVIFSTYPTPTAHLVGYALHRLTGIPWVAEFRDPMVEEGYPSSRLERRIRQWIEVRIVRYASRIVTVTDGCAEMYRSRYGHLGARVCVVENGYDEYLGDSLECDNEEPRSGRLTLLHSGVIYPAERDPSAFFEALTRLKVAQHIDAKSMRVVFRGAGNEERYRAMVVAAGLQDIVEFRPTVPYAVASAEMREADALLILQGAVCNRQIPAKAYEYLYRGKPILAMADPGGDTAKMLGRYGVKHIAALEDADAMECTIRRFLADTRSQEAPDEGPDRNAIEKLSRRARAADMARVFDEVSRGR